MPFLGLDAIDCRIVAALQADGRLTNLELAERVGLSPSPCLRRVKRLERDGYIEGYRAMLQRSRLGLGLTVFVGVKIGGHANVEAEAFQESVVAMPEVVACHLVSGEADYRSKWWCPTSSITSGSWSASCWRCRSCARCA